MSAASRSCTPLSMGFHGLHARYALRTSLVRLGAVASLWLVAAVVTATTALAAGPGVIFDSITGNTPTGSVSASGSTWQAAQFILPASAVDFQLGSVVLNLANNPLGTSFDVDIYDSRRTGSEPNNKIGTLLPPQTIVVGNNTFTPSGTFPLLSPTEEAYWVVLKGRTSAVSWSTAGASGVISPASQAANLTSFTLSNGDDWNSSPAAGNPYMMTVNPVPVPEPSTWAMGLAGLGFAGLTALRRHRRHHRRRQG